MWKRLRRFMYLLIGVFLWTGIVLAETGGLQRLPYPLGTDTVRPSVLTNGIFSGQRDWTLRAGHQYDPNVSRTADGSGSLRLSGIGPAETISFTQVSPASPGRRIYRLRAWLRAEGALGENAGFRIYLSDATHGGVNGCGAWVSLEGLSSDWKEYTSDLGADACAYKHVQETHVSDTNTFDIRARNIPEGVNVWVDDITFEPVVRELVIFPVYPNYRGMLWEDQGTTIQWNSIVDPPEGYATSNLQVTVDVVRAGDEEVVHVVTAPELSPVSDSGPWVTYSVTGMSYDASELPDGSYYLRGRLRDNGNGEVLYTYPDYKIVKEPPSARRDHWKVWVDKHNRLVLNGKPSFIWGTYARFTAARNTFPPEARGNRVDPDTYRSIANGCNNGAIGALCNPAIPATTPWSRDYGRHGSTFLKQMADVKMNAITVHADYGTFNIGFDSPPSGNGNKASGAFTSSGTEVTGEDTQFGAEVVAGDALRINRAGTGTISNRGLQVTGTGTRFLSELQPGDLMVVRPGGSRYVQAIHSDTSLTVTGTTAFTWQDAEFNIQQYRRVTAVNDERHVTLDAPFVPDVGTPNQVAYEKCAPSRYVEWKDEIGAFMTALRDENMWYWHLASNIQGVNATYWSVVPYQPKCHLVRRDDSAEFITSFKPYGATDGFLGFYIADEPAFADARRGIEHTWQVQQGQQRAGYGGVNFWVDGGIPKHAFDQWNLITDAIMPDPYPATGDNLPTYDDFAFGLSTWNKHGRSYQWPRRSAAAVFDSRPLINTIQLFGWFASQGLQASTYPQLSDMKIQLVSSVAAGATGILWWHMGSGSQSLGDRGEDDYMRFQRASKVVADLLPMLEEPIQDLAGRVDGKFEYDHLIDSVSDPDIRCSSRKKGDTILLACANTTNVDKNVTITMTSPISGQVVLPWDGTAIDASGNSFTVLFKGLNGGTEAAGTGTLTASQQTINCASGCKFMSELAPRDTVTANGRTRLVLSVDSDTQLTIDANPGDRWNNHPFTYSSDQDKEKSAHFFLITTGS